MFIKMLKTWRAMRAGQVYDHADGAANLLIDRGYAVPDFQTEDEQELKKSSRSKPKTKPNKKAK